MTRVCKIKDVCGDGLAEVRTFVPKHRTDVYATITFEGEPLRSVDCLALTEAECDKLVRALGYKVTR